MRLSGFVIFLFVFGLCSGSLGKQFVTCIKSAEKLNEIRRKAECIQFVSEEFRKACRTGEKSDFKNWEITCRALWKLEEVEYYETDGVFFCCWKGPYGKGEIIQRGSSNES